MNVNRLYLSSKNWIGFDSDSSDRGSDDNVSNIGNNNFCMFDIKMTKNNKTNVNSLQQK